MSAIPPNYRERLVSAAVAWDSFRRVAIALRKQRAKFMCERTEKSSFTDGAPVFEHGTPCWKSFVQSCRETIDGPVEIDARRLPQEKWCASCVSRESVHQGLREANRNRGIEMRRMQHYARLVKP